MTSDRALQRLLLRQTVFFAIAMGGLLPSAWKALIVSLGILGLAFVRASDRQLSITHRHIYFGVNATYFSVFSASMLVALARRGMEWWLVALLIAFCCLMLFTMARSVYRPAQRSNQAMQQTAGRPLKGEI